MFTVIINDCRDENARGRQAARVNSLIDTYTSFIGVDTDIEAGVNLIETLDATQGKRGIILMNVAPRGGHTKQWENGTPFGYMWYQKTLIVGSVDGLCFSGLKRFGLGEEIKVLDINTAAAAMSAAGFIDEAAAEYIPRTQFRSFDFTPRVAAFIFLGNEVPHTPMPIAEIPDLPTAVWWIDNFGNCKTTMTEQDVVGKTELETRWGTFPLHTQLRNVPDQKTAFTIGSSGLPDNKFVELVIQRASAAKQYGVSIGDEVFNKERVGLKVW
jgi:hypothetical protein